MSDAPHKYFSTTGATISLQWSEIGDSAHRKQTFGGYIQAWKANRVGEFLYVIPRSVTVGTITKALQASVAAHDRAVLTYPHGKSSSGAAVMRIRLFGKAAQDLDETVAAPRRGRSAQP